MAAGAIETELDRVSNTFVVRFPQLTMLADLETWRRAFRARLEQHSGPEGPSLLLDTNTHDFESIECLKFIRSFLENVSRMSNGISRVAFVQPVQYRVPEIVSPDEAYFSTVEEALDWLRS